MTTEERVLRLENAFATLSEMAAQEKSRTDTLLKLVTDHDSRSETQMTWLNQLGAAQANTEEKINALTDGMIRLQEAQTHADARIAALADAQMRTEQALAKLAETVERVITEGRNGHA